jgi:hypothetical protein
MTAQMHNRITFEADKMDGQPCIRGLRFPVVTILRMVAEHYCPLRPPAIGSSSTRTARHESAPS